MNLHELSVRPLIDYLWWGIPWHLAYGPDNAMIACMGEDSRRARGSAQRAHLAAIGRTIRQDNRICPLCEEVAIQRNVPLP
jgi:hypothetical protein